MQMNFARNSLCTLQPFNILYTRVQEENAWKPDRNFWSVSLTQTFFVQVENRSHIFVTALCWTLFCLVSLVFPRTWVFPIPKRSFMVINLNSNKTFLPLSRLCLGWCVQCGRQRDGGRVVHPVVTAQRCVTPLWCVPSLNSYNINWKCWACEIQ